MNTDEKIERRGGFREGSGRKPLGNRKLVTVRLHEDYYKYFVETAKQRGISQSKFVEQMIERERNA